MQANITNLQLILHISFSDNRVKSSSFWRGFKQRMPDPEKFFLLKICKSYYSVATFSGGLKKPLTFAQWIVKPPHCVILGKASERFPITVSCLSLRLNITFFFPQPALVRVSNISWDGGKKSCTSDKQQNFCVQVSLIKFAATSYDLFFVVLLVFFPNSCGNKYLNHKILAYSMNNRCDAFSVLCF